MAEPADVILAANAITILHATGADFKNKDLSGIRIPYAYLPGADFSGTNLRRADLSYVNLQYAQLWSVILYRPVITLGGYDLHLNNIVYDTLEESLFVGSRDGIIRRWRTYAGGLYEKKLDGHDYSIKSLAVNPQKEQLASASIDCTIKVWNLSNLQLIRTLTAHKNSVESVIFSHDGRWLASASDDNTIKLWDASTGDLLYTFAGHVEDVLCVTFSRDDKQLTSASMDYTIRIWDLTEQKLLHNLFNAHVMQSVAYSYIGNYLASGGDEGIIKLWDPITGKLLKTLVGHKEMVNSVAFSPTDNYLISASLDRTIKVWNVAKEEVLHTFVGHTDWVRQIACHRSGDEIGSISSDGSVKRWDLHPTLVQGTQFEHAQGLTYDQLQYIHDNGGIINMEDDHQDDLQYMEDDHDALDVD